MEQSIGGNWDPKCFEPAGTPLRRTSEDSSQTTGENITGIAREIIFESCASWPFNLGACRWNSREAKHVSWQTVAGLSASTRPVSTNKSTECGFCGRGFR